MTLREAAVREWVLLSPEARLALRRYVLHYVASGALPSLAAALAVRWPCAKCTSARLNNVIACMRYKPNLKGKRTPVQGTEITTLVEPCIT